MSIACPKCGMSDSIQKISAIYTGGVATANSGNYTAVSKTQLAERLKQPKEPSKPSISRDILLLIWGGIWVSMLVAFLLVVIFGVLGLSVNWLLAYGAAFLLWTIFCLLKLPNWQKKEKETHDAWERKISKWWELYYCHRDDCVFDPETNVTTSPQNLERLL